MTIRFLPSVAMVDHFDMVLIEGDIQKVVGYVAKTKKGFLGFTRVLCQSSIPNYSKFFCTSDKFIDVKNELLVTFLERGYDNGS
jgi:hypothetical protein